MNYGKFFKLNDEKSDLSQGITCYDYRWLYDNRISQEFPIYVTISKDSIDFYAHYYDYHKHKHSHNTILSLPISANLDVKDGLTGALVEGHNTNFPRYDSKGSSYLWKLHWEAFWENKKMEQLDVSYFELDVFVEHGEKTWKKLMEEINRFVKDGKKKDDYIQERERKADDSNKHPEKINRFIRKLILDFLFDLEHTKVFQTSPYYEHISVKLKENYFFSALAAKANFYYWRKIILNIKKYKDEQHSAYVECYLKAEREWTKYIRNSKAQANFNDFKDKWFCDPEEEMEKVYGKDFKEVDKIVKSYKNKQQKEDIKKSRILSSKWFVWHYRWDLILWRNKEFRCWRLIFPKLVLSVLAAWVTIIIGSSSLFPLEQWKMEFYSYGIVKRDFLPWIIFMGIVIFTIQAVIFYSIRYRSPSLWIGNKRKTLWLFFVRPLKILLISFTFSLIFGFLLSVMFSASVLIPMKDFHLFELFDYNLNSFFWSCVFLAMFIGVVLQQVTDEKYTEE